LEVGTKKTLNEQPKHSAEIGCNVVTRTFLTLAFITLAQILMNEEPNASFN